MFNFKTNLGRLNLYTIFTVLCLSVMFFFSQEWGMAVYFGITVCILMVLGTFFVNVYVANRKE